MTRQAFATLLVACALATFVPILTAQVSVSVEATAPGGVALIDENAQLQSLAIPVGPPITSHTYYMVSTHGTGSQYFSDYTETEITPPGSLGSLSAASVAFESRSFGSNGTAVSSLFTMGLAPGQPGTQRFRITLNAPQPQAVELDVWVFGQNYGNAAISTVMTFGSTTQSWSWAPGQGYSSDHQSWPMQISGTMHVDVEITGQVTPGPGGGLYYDGYDTRWAMTVIPINAGSITYWGTNCGQATLGHVGLPITSSVFTMSIDNVPASAPAYFVVGTRTDFVPFLNLQLPFDMGPMGAPGCTLYVGSPVPWWIQPGNGATANTLDIYLSPWISGTYYIQGLVFDPAANFAGLTLTQAATLTF